MFSLLIWVNFLATPSGNGNGTGNNEAWPATLCHTDTTSTCMYSQQTQIHAHIHNCAYNI